MEGVGEEGAEVAAEKPAAQSPVRFASRSSFPDTGCSSNTWLASTASGWWHLTFVEPPANRDMEMEITNPSENKIY